MVSQGLWFFRAGVVEFIRLAHAHAGSCSCVVLQEELTAGDKQMKLVPVNLCYDYADSYVLQKTSDS